MRKLDGPARWQRFLSIAVIIVAQTGCGGGSDLDDATLVAGRGIEPDLIVGTTTLSQAKGVLGEAAHGQSTATNNIETSLQAGPFTLIFLAPQSGGEPVLHAIRAARVANPNFPRWNGKTAQGVGLLDSEGKVRGAHGTAAAEAPGDWSNRLLYYTNGIIFSTENPTKLGTAKELTPLSADSNYVTFVYVTVPFQILGHDYGRPTTTLPITP